MQHITRQTYLDRLIGLQNTPDIKIITGIRRSGKSQLVKDYISYVNEHDDNANVIYIDFYNLDFEHLKDYYEGIRIINIVDWLLNT